MTLRFPQLRPGIDPLIDEARELMWRRRRRYLLALLLAAAAALLAVGLRPGGFLRSESAASGGRASRGDQYSVRQVKTAFASQGIVLHGNPFGSVKGTAFLTGRGAGHSHQPGVIVAVIPASVHGSFFASGRRGHIRVQRLGDVRLVVLDGAMTSGARRALRLLSRANAPSAKPPATTPTTPPPPPTYAQALAKMPAPLRTALEKTATVRSAHVVLSGLTTGSGDFSTALKFLTFRSVVDGYRTQKVISGGNEYDRFAAPGTSMPAKWFERDTTAAPTAIRAAWPELGLLTFLQPLVGADRPGRVTLLGHARLGGVDTTHYRDRIVLGAGADVPAFASASFDENLDFWVGRRDGLIHRASLCVAGVTELTATISHFGEHVHVAIPSPLNVIAPSGAGTTTSVVSQSSAALGTSGRGRCG